ncbi:hypothetical protein JI667_05270 [Bacillus sp. NTK074B]|uniref:hypothetical protein n=1 Tax=Bacillus sp. NTK074B TaxID=2802174 RepID=UPI001A8E09C9|nr:hypothetical protein [Bacillus sp. NTK074B]
MLFYDEVKRLFPDTKGINLPGFAFLIVSNSTSMTMEKGLYVPFSDEIDLLKSIEMGAIASLWSKEAPIPSYVPNHFPLFIVDDVYLAYVHLLEIYKQNYNQEKWEIMTKFIFTNEANDQALDLSLNKSSHELDATRERGGE